MTHFECLYNHVLFKKASSDDKIEFIYEYLTYLDKVGRPIEKNELEEFTVQLNEASDQNNDKIQISYVYLLRTYLELFDWNKYKELEKKINIKSLNYYFKQYLNLINLWKLVYKLKMPELINELDDWKLEINDYYWLYCKANLYVIGGRYQKAKSLLNDSIWRINQQLLNYPDNAYLKDLIGLMESLRNNIFFLEKTNDIYKIINLNQDYRRDFDYLNYLIKSYDKKIIILLELIRYINLYGLYIYLEDEKLWNIIYNNIKELSLDYFPLVILYNTYCKCSIIEKFCSIDKLNRLSKERANDYVDDCLEMVEVNRKINEREKYIDKLITHIYRMGTLFTLKSDINPKKKMFDGMKTEQGKYNVHYENNLALIFSQFTYEDQMAVINDIFLNNKYVGDDDFIHRSKEIDFDVIKLLKTSTNKKKLDSNILADLSIQIQNKCNKCDAFETIFLLSQFTKVDEDFKDNLKKLAKGLQYTELEKICYTNELPFISQSLIMKNDGNARNLICDKKVSSRYDSIDGFFKVFDIDDVDIEKTIKKLMIDNVYDNENGEYKFEVLFYLTLQVYSKKEIEVYRDEIRELYNKIFKNNENQVINQLFNIILDENTVLEVNSIKWNVWNYKTFELKYICDVLYIIYSYKNKVDLASKLEELYQILIDNCSLSLLFFEKENFILCIRSVKWIMRTIKSLKLDNVEKMVYILIDKDNVGNFDIETNFELSSLIDEIAKHNSDMSKDIKRKWNDKIKNNTLYHLAKNIEDNHVNRLFDKFKNPLVTLWSEN